VLEGVARVAHSYRDLGGMGYRCDFDSDYLAQFGSSLRTRAVQFGFASQDGCKIGIHK
jgi:hypothetical protein